MLKNKCLPQHAFLTCYPKTRYLVEEWKNQNGFLYITNITKEKQTATPAAYVASFLADERVLSEYQHSLSKSITQHLNTSETTSALPHAAAALRQQPQPGTALQLLHTPGTRGRPGSAAEAAKPGAHGSPRTAAPAGKVP